MLVGIGSYTLPWAIGIPPEVPPRPLDHAGLLAVGVELGAEVVQFADNLPVHELGDDALDALRGAADRAGIRIEVGVRGIDDGMLRSAARAAARLGSPFVRTLLEDGGTRVDAARAVGALAPLEHEYRALGLRLALENHDGHRTDELLAVVDSLGDWCGICLDTVNSFGALDDPDRVIAAFAPAVVAVHAKDFTITRQWHRMGFDIVGAPVGEGRLDVAGLVAAVASRAESAVVELWTPPQADLPATVALEREWAERSMIALRAARDAA